MRSAEFCRIADRHKLTGKRAETLVCYSPTSWSAYRYGRRAVPLILARFMEYVDRLGMPDEVERRSEQLFERDAYNAARAVMPPSVLAWLPIAKRFQVHAVNAVCLAFAERDLSIVY